MSFLYLCLTSTKMTENRSSHPELLCKTVFRNFAKLTGQLVCQSLFFNKVAGLRPKTLLKKRLWHGFFPVNFAKFLRTKILTKHLRWLLPQEAIMKQLLVKIKVWKVLRSYLISFPYWVNALYYNHPQLLFCITT